MAIEVDGEKYACEACVRGHRVSNCTHKDRELRHINKKGRPVSQCPHCRGLRKSRSAHVKCVCVVDTSQGPPTPTTHNAPPTMITLGTGAMRLPPAADGKLHNLQQPTTPGHACACMHGQPCNCSLKREREHGDVNEMARTAAMNATHRRSASNGKPVMAYRRSDSTVPNVRHSFHPPLHHRNHAAHEHGIPYPLKRASASHGSLGMSSVQRSVDSLPLQAYSSAAAAAAAASSPAHFGNWPPIPQLHSPNFASPSVAAPTQFDMIASLPQHPASPFAGRAMSPGNNQQRHSMNDFSMLWNSDPNAARAFGHPAPGYFASSLPSSATAESLPMSWSELDLAGSCQYNAMAQQNPPTPSVESVDPQPSLSRSSSGTESDTAESSHANFGDFSFGSLSQPSTTSLGSQWQTGSWQGHSALVDTVEDAFNQQKTPKAPHPDNYIGNMDDYFGSYDAADANSSATGAEACSASSAVEPDMPTWSTGSPPPTSSYGDLSGLMMSSHNDGGAVGGDGCSEAWSSQIDLSSYGTSDSLNVRHEQQNGSHGGGGGGGTGGDQYPWV